MNLKKIRKERLNVGFGYNNQSNRLTDAPLIINRQTKFVDPVNGVVKKDVAGIEFPISTTLPLTSWSYGFYFYPIEELLKHMREFNCIFSVRYSKRPPKTDKWHLRSQNLDIIHGYLSKKEELKKPHIPAVRELIDAFYHPMMVGAAIRNIQKDQRWKQILRRGVNSINTLRFMMSDFRCIHDVQVWCPLEDESQEPLDVKSLYMQQDPYLPPQLRINWEDVGRRAKKWHSLSPDQPLLPHVKSEIVD